MTDEEVNSYYTKDASMAHKRIQASILKQEENKRLAKRTGLDEHDINAGGLDFASAREMARKAHRLASIAFVISLLGLLVAGISLFLP